MSFSIREMLNVACKAAEEKKAFDIVVLDIKGVSVLCDYFLICSGHSGTQVRSIAENIEEKLSEKGVEPKRREGLRESRWVLLDYGDLVVHVFREEERDFYKLEHLWADAEVVNLL